MSVDKIPANLRTLAFWKYHQQMSNHTRIKSNNRILLEPFCYNFCNSWSPFDTFQMTSGNKRVHWNCLKPIAVESQLEMKYNWISDCYNLELALSFLPWLEISISTHLFYPRDWSCLDFNIALVLLYYIVGLGV